MRRNRCNALLFGIGAALLAGCGAMASFVHAPRYIYVTNLARSDSGTAPSVTVYPAERSGNVPPSEVITGPHTAVNLTQAAPVR